jgi:hypothetical protein
LFGQKAFTKNPCFRRQQGLVWLLVVMFTVNGPGITILVDPARAQRPVSRFFRVKHYCKRVRAVFYFFSKNSTIHLPMEMAGGFQSILFFQGLRNSLAAQTGPQP